jgi:DNA-binding FrmR family transcriptional regulator
MQQEVVEFRRRERVYRSGASFSAEHSGVMDLEVRQREMRANRAMYAEMLEELRTAGPGEATDRLQSLISVAEIASNPVVSGLWSDLVSHERERNAMTSGRWARSETNPDVRRFDELIEDARAKLTTAVASHLRAIDARLSALNQLHGQRVASVQQMPEMEAEEEHLVQQVEAVRSLANQLRSEYHRAGLAAAVEEGDVRIVDLADGAGSAGGSGPQPGAPRPSRRVHAGWRDRPSSSTT